MPEFQVFRGNIGCSVSPAYTFEGIFDPQIDSEDQKFLWQKNERTTSDTLLVTLSLETFSESSYEISWFWWFFKIMSTFGGIFGPQIDSEDKKF